MHHAETATLDLYTVDYTTQDAQHGKILFSHGNHEPHGAYAKAFDIAQTTCSKYGLRLRGIITRKVGTFEE